jgi:hypothetical protein
MKLYAIRAGLVALFFSYLLLINSSFGSNGLESAPSSFVTVRGVLQTTHVFTNREIESGSVIRRQTFLILSQAVTPIVIDVTRTSLANDEIPPGTTLNIEGFRRQLSKDQLHYLENRPTSDSFSDEKLLSTVYRVLSLLWRSGAIRAGTYPEQITWIEAQ